MGDQTPGEGVNIVVAHSTLANTIYAREGYFRSENSGDNWERIDAGPQDAVLTFLHSNMEGSMQTSWLFAGTERGVARPMDCFCFWSDAGELRGRVTAVTYDSEAPKNVYAVAEDALYHSADGGESWSKMATPTGPVLDLAVVSGRLYAGTPTGLFVMTGTAWEQMNA